MKRRATRAGRAGKPPKTRNAPTASHARAHEQNAPILSITQVHRFLHNQDPERCERAIALGHSEAIRNPTVSGLTISGMSLLLVFSSRTLANRFSNHAGRVPGMHQPYYRASVTFSAFSGPTMLTESSFSCSCPDWGRPCKVSFLSPFSSGTPFAPYAVVACGSAADLVGHLPRLTPFGESRRRTNSWRKCNSSRGGGSSRFCRR